MCLCGEVPRETHLRAESWYNVEAVVLGRFLGRRIMPIALQN